MFASIGEKRDTTMPWNYEWRGVILLIQGMGLMCGLHEVFLKPVRPTRNWLIFFALSIIVTFITAIIVLWDVYKRGGEEGPDDHGIGVLCMHPGKAVNVILGLLSFLGGLAIVKAIILQNLWFDDDEEGSEKKYWWSPESSHAGDVEEGGVMRKVGRDITVQNRGERVDGEKKETRCDENANAGKDKATDVLVFKK